MKYVSILFFVVLSLPCSAVATPQIGDTIIFGGKEYVTAQQPMLGYWKIGNPPKGSGKVAPPKFEINDSANWRGYVATWEIRDSQVTLKSVRCTIDGKEATAHQVMPNHKLPAKAVWFKGRIQIAVGDWDEERQQFGCMLTFHITQGVVTRTTFQEWGNYVPTWNGLAKAQSDVPADKPK